ncbi:MAG TPA: hypothetical protein VFN55_17975 [Solirubrobacteraceae bacterium]|nr:hypothetical protein [Solirubrobacteraceae bacterium]
MSDAPETPADEPAAVVPDEPTEVRPPAADLAAGGPPAPAVEPDSDAAIAGATPVTAAPAPEPVVPSAEPAAPAWTPPAPPLDSSASDSSSSGAAAVQDRPELAVAGAFAGGLVLAMILKRLAR